MARLSNPIEMQGAGARAQVGDLARELSDFVGVQLSASRRDVAQAQTILSDAIERLMQCLPRAEAFAVRANGRDPLDTTGRLAQAMINLQFQDMVSQLLQRADDRLAGLDALLQQLARILEAKDPDAVQTAVHWLGAQTLAPERRTSNSIQQVNMAPGDVELF